MKRAVFSFAIAAIAVLGTGVAASASSATTHFAATYFGGPNATTLWTCNGNHIVSNGAGTKDTETCAITGDTSGFVAGTWKSNPALGTGFGVCTGAALAVIPWYNTTVPPYQTCWLSDFNGAPASQFTWNVDSNGDGTFTLYIVAYYNS